VKLLLPTPYVEAERVFAHVVSVDTFGNVALDISHDDGMAAGLRLGASVRVNGTPATYARTFEDVGPGELMLYEDAYRTLALAINRGSAQEFLDLGPGDEVQIEP
jgi:S-adenosylmethionine hydrolase